MKNKKENIIGLIVNSSIFVILVLLGIIYFYPSIMDIEQKKDDLLKLQGNYSKLISTGLSYPNFKSIHLPGTTIYENKILGKIDPAFYSNNFTNSNNKFPSYEKFLDNLDSEIKGKLKKDYEDKHNKIYSIIPIYIDGDNNINSETINDFKFINKVEQLLYKYNLTTDSAIGIKSLDKVKDYSEKNIVKSDLGADIYSITLPLSIKGKKKNIISFLQEIYSMGRIHKGDITKGQKDIIFDNEQNFVELESMKMDKYIDNTPSVTTDNKDNSLVYTLTKTDQKDQSFSMDIKLVFYVQGLPNYKIKENILSILGKQKSKGKKSDGDNINYFNLKSKVKKLEGKYRKNKLLLIQLNEINSYLNSLNTKVSVILKDINKNQNLLKDYNYVQKLKSIFVIINKKLDGFK